ncbi:hypothetical protein [Methanosphaerula palustris]|uniref:DUF7982 domain-containing protein n=1 Tax=Methanosphaerula palustris (strain ATCC BAA-1556 / DSM 19958 / E1-9c) TaxID=521011 RepID=B8GGS9_METPE|nr:hypothetical protein [Methanosphaerula palustris]ACL16334.1 hypothetical protein Mpal_0983 [Methanosphaerula palustris E1-9c]
MKKRFLAVSGLLGWLLLVIVLMIISGNVNSEIYFVLGLLGLMVVAILITPIYSKPRYAKKLLLVRFFGAFLFIALFFEQFITGLPGISIPLIGSYIPLEQVLIIATSLLGVVSVFIGAIVLNNSQGISSEMMQKALAVSDEHDCRRMREDAVSYYIPPEKEGSSVMQFVPESVEKPAPSKAVVTCINGEQVRGQFMVPSGYPLLQMLRKSYDLRLPVKEEALLVAIKEICEDVIEIADTVDAVRKEGFILIELHNFRLMSICTDIKDDFPTCCKIYPCPICSLIACILAEGLGITCTIEHVRSDPRVHSITLYLSLIPLREPVF